jgi:sucrose-6F-phosphate phosphohydrolase
MAATSSSSSVLDPVLDSKPNPRVMIVSDLDNTMVDHHDKQNTALAEFGSQWHKDYSHDSLLVYSTGRSPHLYQELKTSVPLITPDIVICSVGTEITRGSDLAPDAGWEEFLNQGWDRSIVVEEASKFDKLRLQADSEQRPHKVSFNADKHEAGPIKDALAQRLKERGLRVKIIYSGGCDLDILPQGAGKGKALEYLLKTLKARNQLPKNTLVCGDSGNDIELFEVEEVDGVIVGNAMEELRHWHEQQAAAGSAKRVFRATERCAAGIMQAMKHFGIKA